VPTLYSLKGEVVRRGLRQVFGVDMPIFEKRRFQHGAISRESLRQRLPAQEARYRREFLAMYS
jgi:asparagine synthase (glutamine-hydrolysing)